MRRYTILKISKTSGANTYVYTATRAGNNLTGNYKCERLQDRKIITDFICMPDSKIISVEDNTTRLSFVLGENTPQGVITKFEPFSAQMNVYLNHSRTNPVILPTLTKTINIPVAAAPIAVAPSRSQILKEIVNLENIILENRPIRLEKTKKTSLPKTLEEFLILFFKEWNNEKNTIHVDDKSVQTELGKRRSLEDIFIICKYYFNDCTLKEVLTLLYTTLPLKITKGFRTSYCNTIHKRVWYYSETQNNAVIDAKIEDEYKHFVDWYKDKL